MRRIERQHQPVEKPPPAARAFEKQPIHLRGQPHHAEVLAERRLAARRLAVDPHHPALDGFRRIAAGADAQCAAPRREGRGDRPASGHGGGTAVFDRGAPVDLGQFRAAQPAPRRQKRDGFEQIGFAGAIWPGQHDRAGVERQPRRGIIAEIGQRQAGHADAAPRRHGGRGTGAPTGFLCLGQHANYMVLRVLYIHSPGLAAEGGGSDPHRHQDIKRARIGPVAHDRRRGRIRHHELRAFAFDLRGDVQEVS